MNKWQIEIPTSFETERLHLRRYQPGDGGWYYAAALRNRDHLARYESGNPLHTLPSADEAEKVVRDFARRWQTRDSFFMGAFSKTTAEFVAQIYIGSICWNPPEFELGYVVDVDHQSQGYVTEAARGALNFIFEWLGAERVRLECDDTNTRSYRVAERCGLTRVGHLAGNKRHVDGSVSGTLLYQITRREQLALQAGDLLDRGHHHVSPI